MIENVFKLKKQCILRTKIHIPTGWSKKIIEKFEKMYSNTLHSASTQFISSAPKLHQSHGTHNQMNDDSFATSVFFIANAHSKCNIRPANNTTVLIDTFLCIIRKWLFQPDWDAHIRLYTYRRSDECEFDEMASKQNVFCLFFHHNHFQLLFIQCLSFRVVHMYSFSSVAHFQ